MSLCVCCFTFCVANVFTRCSNYAETRGCGYKRTHWRVRQGSLSRDNRDFLGYSFEALSFFFALDSVYMVNETSNLSLVQDLPM